MDFNELFRTKYVPTLHAARRGDNDGVREGLASIVEILKTQYEAKNGDSIKTKAQLKYYLEVFEAYYSIAVQYGLEDRRLLKLFDLIKDEDLPSISNIMDGSNSVSGDDITKSKQPNTSDSDKPRQPNLNIDDLIPKKPKDKNPSQKLKDGDKDIGDPSNKPDIPFESKNDPNDIISKLKDPNYPNLDIKTPHVVSISPDLPSDGDKDISKIPFSPKNPNKEPYISKSPELPIDDMSTWADDNLKDGGGIDAPVFDPESLEGFIGQQRVVKRIVSEIKAAKKRGEQYLDHILLFGSRGLGKSTLMKLVAKELGVRFEFLDCTGFKNDGVSKKALQRFLQNVARYEEPVVIGFDEIGFCPTHLQAGLLTLLNDRKFSWLDDSGRTHYLSIDNFTFIGATTDPQDLLPTIKDRCRNLTFYLEDYSKPELKRIFLNKFASKKLKIEDDALLECINRCRSSIREVNSFVKGLDTLALNAGVNTVTLDMTKEYFSNAELDPIGLNKKEREILHALLQNSSGTMSEDNLAAVVGLDTKVYRSEYEQYLLKIGFVTIISGRGRALTDKAREYLKLCKM